MPNIKFTLGDDSFSFSNGRAYPLYDPAGVTVIEIFSAGKQMFVHDKEVEIQIFNLFFEKLSGTDYDNFENWLQNIAVGPQNTFTYSDENGNAHTVRLLNTRNPLKEISHGNFAGTIQLREEVV